MFRYGMFDELFRTAGKCICCLLIIVVVVAVISAVVTQ